MHVCIGGWGGGGGIDYKCIPLSSSVCFEPNFKTFESLKFLEHDVLSHFPKYLYNFACKF